MALGPAVTDEALLRQLNAQDENTPKKRKLGAAVTDENLLRQLNAPEQESTLKSAAMAIPRIGYDLGEGAVNWLQKVPGLIDKAQTEIPGLFEVLQNNPKSLGKQFAAGVSEHGKNVFNLPHDIVNYGTKRLHLFPEKLNEHIQMGRMPEDTEKMINQTFGEPTLPGETLGRGLGRNVSSLGAVGKGILNSPALLRTKKYFSNELLKAHDALENSATKGFNKVSEEVVKRNLPNFNVDPYFIDSLREYFPKTKSYENLINKAMTGDYNALRKLQSDLYTKGKKNINSPLAAESDRGYEMFEKRNDINNEISQNLKNMGQNDLSNILDKSRNEWKQLQQTYYNKDLSPTLRKMFNPDVRRIPKNVAKLLSEESIPVNKLLDAHPTLREKLINYNRKNSALKLGAGAVGISGLSKLLYDRLLQGNK